MKKGLLLFLLTMLVSVLKVDAQETVIFYPDFRYDNNRGFTKQTIQFGGTEHNNLWYRVSALPAEANLGYAREGDQKSIKVSATPASGGVGLDKYYITDTYAVIDAVDLSGVSSAENAQVTFFALNQFGKGDVSNMQVLISTDYIDDVATANWTDVTAELDQLAGIGDDWVKSTLSLNDYIGQTSVTLAFHYTCPATGDISETEQSSTWNVAEVRFTATQKSLDNVMTWQFDNWNNFELIEVTNANGQVWSRTSSKLRPGLVPPNGETYYSVQATAVFNDGSTSGKGVSPTEVWTVLSSVDLTGYDKAFLSFWNISEYKKGGDSDLKIMMSTDYVKSDSDKPAAIANANWVDVTSGFVLDESIPYDTEWTQTIGEISVDVASPNVVIAFVYSCTDTYSDVNGDNAAFRAGTWRIGDVNVLVEPKPTSIGSGFEKDEPLFYPNPVSDFLQISQDVSSLIIFNLNGSMVKNIQNASGGVNVADLVPGIYILKIATKEGTIHTTKLIKR